MNSLSQIFKKANLVKEKTQKTDPRLPIKAIAGLHNLSPWNCVTTQIHTANWPYEPNSVFLELKGCWYIVPPMDVIVLSGDGEIQGNSYRKLNPDEIVDALQFIRDNWTFAKPHISLVEISRKIIDNPDPLNCLVCGDLMNWDLKNEEYTCLCGGVKCTKDPHRDWVTIRRNMDPERHR